MSNQTKLKSLMVKHSLGYRDVARLANISIVPVYNALKSRRDNEYKRFSDVNLSKLKLGLEFVYFKTNRGKGVLAL